MKTFIISANTHVYTYKITTIEKRIKCLLNSNKISYTSERANTTEERRRREKIVIKSDVKIIHGVM